VRLQKCINGNNINNNKYNNNIMVLRDTGKTRTRGTVVYLNCFNAISGTPAVGTCRWCYFYRQTERNESGSYRDNTIIMCIIIYNMTQWWRNSIIVIIYSYRMYYYAQLDRGSRTLRSDHTASDRVPLASPSNRLFWKLGQKSVFCDREPEKTLATRRGVWYDVCAFE